MIFTTAVFPLCAVLIFVIAYFEPEWFSGLSFLIVPLLGLIMFGMGSTLSLTDFKNAMKKPRAVLLGMVLQFLLMPLLAYLIGCMLDLPKDLFIGMVMVGTVAGGTASNVIAYLAGGDVALSITMTACSTVAGIVMTPLLSKFYLGQTVDVPALAMFKSILLVVALPVSAGLIVNRVFRKRADILCKVCPLISAAGIVFVIGIIMSLNVHLLRNGGFLVISAVVLHNISGLASGYFFARLFRFDRRTAVTIAIEVGMQNSGLAVALSKQFFGAASALPGALFSIFHNISGAIVASAVKPLILHEKTKNK